MSIISRTVKSLNTLAVDTNVFSGMNKISRKISSNSQVEFGDFSAQRILNLAPASASVLDLVVYSIIVLTDQPITLTMGALSPITVKKLFVYYGEVSSIRFENNGVANANISFSYVADPIPVSALSLTFLHLAAGMSAGMPLTNSADTVVYPPLPAPVADFSVSATSGIAPFGVSFTDTTMNNPTSWHWAFGDGNTSTTQNPSHVYSAAGTYSVTLTASNALGSDRMVKASLITITPTTVFVPVANFTSDVGAGSIPFTVTFTDTSTSSPTSWFWDFGDGVTSASQNPSHEYTTAGTYNVSLRATNAAGSNTITTSAGIVAHPHIPVAAFTSDVTTGATPLLVSFTDTSTNSPTSWLWDFGDGTTSTERNPTKTYAIAGTYSVSLTATNAAGSAQLIKSNSISAAA